MAEDIVSSVLVRIKKMFYDKINESRLVTSSNSTFLTDERYEMLINEVIATKNAPKRKPRDYWLLKRYDVLVVQNKNNLIFPVKSEVNRVLYYVKDSDLFDILHSVHVSIGHGGRDRMLKELSSRYKNVTRKDAEIFLQLCEPCQQKQKSQKKGIVTKPLIFSEFNSRCQVDLIDFQSHPDGNKKFILVYQDHLTKFIVLKALESKRAEEVAFHLLDIFCLIGAPSVLQSDNGREFANQIVTNLKSYWPELTIVHGKPRHSQSQGSVERANQDVENMLTTWMQDNKTSKWADGLRFVQVMKNRAYHSGIKRSPYEALFGSKMKIGLSTSNLPVGAIKDIENEEALDEAIRSINTPENVTSHNIENSAMECDESIIDIPEFGDPNPTENNDPVKESSSENCAVCSDICKDEIHCQKCQRIIHKNCSVASQIDSSPLCNLCANKENALNERADAHGQLKIQANKMLKLSSKQFPPASVGMTVRVPIPDVDRGRGDARNILAIVTEVTDDGFYRLGTKGGILKQLYSRSQFSTCKAELLNIQNIPLDTEISLRSAATQSSIGTGQGFVKCSCSNKCINKKCSCKRRGLLCQSKCHSSLPCTNK